MEDERLKKIFGDFTPEMSPDYIFINRLKNNLESVEMIRDRSIRLKARCRKAVVLAAFVGMSVGFLLAMILPAFANTLLLNARNVFNDSFLNVIEENSTLVAGMAIASISLIVSLSVYDLALSWRHTKE